MTVNDTSNAHKLKEGNETTKRSNVEESTPLPPSPDGGWGWVTVAASFYIHAMIDGLFSVFGVFLPQFLEHYGSSRAKTAVIGSLLSACLLMIGPVASVLVSVFSCRKVAMTGALLISGGLVLSTLAPTIDVLIVTFGVISGIGLGLIFLPGAVIVGFWFEKKRALAMGLASSGAGLGMLTMAPLSGILLEHFDWKNALVLIAGVMLQGVICGALLRPVEFSEHETDDFPSKDAEVELHMLKTKPRVRTTSLDNHSPQSLKSKKLTNQLLQDTSNDAEHFKETESFIENERIYYSSQQITQSSHLHSSNPLLRKDIFYSGSIQDIDKRHRGGSILHQSGNLSQNKSSLIGNAGSFQPFHSEANDVSPKCCGRKDYLQVAMSMLSVHILKDPAFIVICLANSLAQGGFVLCIYFTVDYGISLGITAETASYLVSAYGIGTTAGRFTSGLMVALPWFRAEYVTSLSLILAGLFAIISGAFCSNFISLAICTALTGLFVAPIVPLTSVMSVDYLGLENLTNAHGMVSVGKGIVSMITAPLAGLLQDLTGSYSPPFYIAGGIFILGGILHLLLPLVNSQKERSFTKQ